MNRFPGFSGKKRLLAGLLFSLVLLVVGAGYWLLHTASGAQWIWARAEALSAGTVSASDTHGDLASGYIIQDFGFKSDGVELSVGLTEIRAGVAWWPLSVQLRKLELADVTVLVTQDTESVENEDAETDFETALDSLKLPLPIKVHDAILTNIRIQQGNDSSAKMIESFRFQAELDQRLNVSFMQITAAGIEAGLHGYLVLAAPYEMSAAVEGRVEMNPVSGVDDLMFPFKLGVSGNSDKLQFSLLSDEIGLELGGDVQTPLSIPLWNIEGGLFHLSWPLDETGQALDLSGLKLVSQGRVDDWSFELASAVQYDPLQESQLAISGFASTNGLQISHATLTGPEIDLGLDGHLDWSSQPAAGLNAVFKQLDLAPWLAEWPAATFVTGDVGLQWSERGLKIPAGRLTVAGTDLSINIGAEIDFEANTVAGQLDWSGLSYPLKSSTPEFSSPAAKLSVSGSVDNWTTDGQIELQFADYPQGRFEIEGRGNRTAAELAIIRGEVLGGSVNGELTAEWENALIWNAKMRASNVNPEPLAPGWPGRLNLDIELGTQDHPGVFQMNLASLDGVLRGISLSGQGGLSIEEDNIRFKELQFRTEDAELKINGAVTEVAGATVKFKGLLPSLLLEGARGDVDLHGHYSSYNGQQKLSLQLQAEDLVWKEYGLKHLAVNTAENGTTGVIPAIQLNASGLAWQDSLLEEIAITLEPAGGQHRLTSRIKSGESTLSTLMTLTPESAADVIGGQWRGVVEELNLAIDDVHNFGLREPADFEWSAETAVLGPLCLREDKGATACLNANYQFDGDWSLIADITAVPFDYLRDILELDVHFEQSLEGHLEWHQPHGQAPTGGAEFQITAGRILDLQDNEQLAETKAGRFGFSLQNGNLESGVLDLEFPGIGFIDVDFDVLDIVEDGARILQGRAVTRMDSIEPIGQLLFSGVDHIDGSFESDIRLTGTLTDPAFSGGFRYSNGFIQYLPLGLTLEDIEFDGQVEKRDRGSLKGQFRAGEGQASVDGRFLFENMEKVQIDVAISGDQLLLVNTDTLKIVTETDLKVALSPQRVDINGFIKVPSARLTPSNLLVSGINDSEDLVVESRVADLQPVKNERPEGNRIYGQLEVAFGKDVLIQVPGVETTIGGSVVYNWSGDVVPVAQGSYKLKGTVDVYGPKLDINNGSISFPRVPADNPILNIRASRDIFGNTQVSSAGVRVIGTLKRPVVEAYTVPATNEDRAWTLLITGTDFDQGQGVGGFNVGTYIAPKLYVSYGISLFEDENVISARYDLKKGFGVKVTSGQRETGLDISYTIDK